MAYTGNSIDFNDFSNYIISLLKDLGLVVNSDFGVNSTFSRLVQFNYKRCVITCSINRTSITIHVKGNTCVLASKSLCFPIDLQLMYEDSIREVFVAYITVIIEDMVNICELSKASVENIDTQTIFY